MMHSLISPLTAQHANEITQHSSTAWVSDFIQQLIRDAFKENASDIHFEPKSTTLRIRFRIDGILHHILQLPHTITATIISHLKISAKLDIAEKRLPQDGRTEMASHQGENFDCRINSWPTLHGEKLVLRLLAKHASARPLNQLGLTADEQTTLEKSIQKPQGLILITGPTGSGKTTTLYSALSALNHNSKNICTIEDPIEIQLSDVNQLNVNHAIGLDFNRALRALLRQDPDIIMVGEIRDVETANMVINAAQTGHLVFSTLHTNGALETLNRLLLMGIPAINIAEALQLIIAQRLIRLLCPHCKIRNSDHDFIANGCKHCFQGYRGRTGIYEFLCFTSTLKQKIAAQQSIDKVSTTHPLHQSGLNKVQLGLSSLAEITRVTGNIH